MCGVFECEYVACVFGCALEVWYCVVRFFGGDVMFGDKFGVVFFMFG